ncbi:hypothetical protein BFS10_00690 [Brucella suis]|nr:hypothetical protein BFS10_00690 [Brucella suis]
MRAAVSYVNQGLGTAILVGREEHVEETARAAGLDLNRPGIEVINAAYADYLYRKIAAQGPSGA